MGKHKNKSQITILIEFMEENPDLAKGFSKRDKSLVNSLWQELVDALNAAGPPTKDVWGWKKVWAEWKSDLKKKLGENVKETRATGGGPFSQNMLTQSEEAIVRICGMIKATKGAPGISLGIRQNEGDENSDDIPSTSSKRTGIRQKEDDENSDDIPSTSSKRIAETPPAPNTPKKRKEDVSQRLSSFLDEDSENKKDLNTLIGELIKVEKENASNIRRVYKAIEKGTESFENKAVELKNELRSISVNVLTSMKEKNELKQKQLNLDILKFEYEKNKK